MLIRVYYNLHTDTCSCTHVNVNAALETAAVLVELSCMLQVQSEAVVTVDNVCAMSIIPAKHAIVLRATRRASPKTGLVHPVLLYCSQVRASPLFRARPFFF